MVERIASTVVGSSEQSAPFWVLVPKARNYPPRFVTALRARAFAAGKKVSKAQSASAFSTIKIFCALGLSCALLFHPFHPTPSNISGCRRFPGRNKDRLYVPCSTVKFT
jgi:hypothetical protein